MPLTNSIKNVANLRLAGEIYAAAANTILSTVIDEFFTNPTTFIEVAHKLGFHALEESEEKECMEDVLKAFFYAVCDAPEITGADLARYKGGWRRIDTGTNTPIADLWEQVRDPGQSESRKCTGEDWQKLVGKTEPILFEIREGGPSTIFVRFRSASTTKVHRYGRDLR